MSAPHVRRNDLRTSETIKRVRLGEVASMFIDGDWIESKDQSSEGFRLVQTGNIGVGEYLDKSDRAKYVSVETFERLKCTEIFAGDVLVSRLPDPVGRACVLPDLGQRAITAVDCSIVRFDSAKCDANYFVHFTKSKEYERQLSKYLAGSTRIRISRKNLQTTEIPLPPLPAQRRIAAALDKISEMKRNAEARLQKLDLLVKSRFNEMFGDVVRNDKGWMTRPLGEMCEIVRGGSPRPIEKFLGGTIPWIKIGDATVGDSVYLHATKEHIIKAGLSKTRLVKPGSLIFANCGVSLGFARIVTFEGCIHDGWLALINISSELDKIFLLRSLNQMTVHFRKIAPAGTQPNLNTEIMKRHRQVLPPIDLQREFVAYVEKVEALKATAQASLARVDLLYRAKLQEYFG